MSKDRAANYKAASAALGLLTATYEDDHRFGDLTFEYLATMGNNIGKVLRLTTGMTVLARLLIGMRQSESGVSRDETLAELGRLIQRLFPDSEN